MKHFFLLIFVLLVVLGSVNALKLGETTVITIDGTEKAVTFNDLVGEKGLDLKITDYIVSQDVGVGQTIMNTKDGVCLYYITGESISDDKVDIKVSKCESVVSINNWNSEDIADITVTMGTTIYCIDFKYSLPEQTIFVESGVVGDCSLQIPTTPVNEPSCPDDKKVQSPLLYMWGEDVCFSSQTICSEPLQVKVDVADIALCPKKGCQQPFSGKINYLWKDNTCFSTQAICNEPLQVKVDVAEDSFCPQSSCNDAPLGEWPAQYILEDNTCFSSKTLCSNPLMVEVNAVDNFYCIAQPKDTGTCPYNKIIDQTQYIWKDNVCFTAKSICSDPLKIVVDVLANVNSKESCKEIVKPVTTGEETKKSDGSKKDEGSGDGDKGAKEEAGFGGGGGGGSMSGVPLNIPKSNALFNDGYCKTQLHKQKCKDGYRTYKCQAYNIKGKFKDFKEECASCNNNKQDLNEEGVDCGGICANKCLVTEEGKGTITQPSFGKTEGTPIVTEPSAFEKYRIPIIILIAIIGLIVGMVLWIHKPKQEGYTVSATQTQKEKEDIPARLKGIPQDEVDSMKKYIKTQLGKGVDRQKITSILESIGWKQEIIDYIFDEMQHHVLPAQYEEQLRRYIGYYIHKGVAQDKIKATLLKSGWQEEVINKILVDLK